MNSPVPVAARRPVWLDADPGFDDALTMLMLAVNPGLHWLGMSVVAGNAPLANTLANALSVREFFGLKLPIHAGCAQPLATPLVTAQAVLGAQGMRTHGPPLPEAQGGPDGVDGVAAMLAALHASPQPVSVLAIGPLTNLATALQRDPTAAARIAELVMMGGSTERGNHTPAAEFNMHADPEAAEIVFNAGLPVRMFGLNLCRQVLVNDSHVQQVRHWPGARAQVLAGYLSAYQRIRSADSSADSSADASVPMPLYDPVVAAWLAAPGLFEFSNARVDIETRGHFTRGMTVCDFKAVAGRSFNAHVAMRADGPAVVALMLNSLRALLA